MRRYTLAVSACVLAAGIVFAGDGRIEISQSMVPYTITNSGSYVITENLSVTNTGYNGIDVQADSVTIDMNGFTLRGPGATSSNGICQASSCHNLTVRNGVVSQWQGGSRYGVYAAGKGNRVEDITAVHNYSGFYSGEGSIIADCIAVSNTASGSSYGIRSGVASTIARCSVHENSSGNTMVGLHVDNRSMASQCNVYNNSAGTICMAVYGLGGAEILDCAIMENSGSSLCYGVYGITSVRVSGCSLYGNTSSSTNGAAIWLFEGGSVQDCILALNMFNGVEVDDNAAVLNNTCNENGKDGAGHGIYVKGNGNRIEGNNVTDSNGGYGISSVASNLVIRNSCRGNTLGDYSLSTALAGPIVSGTGTITNTNPWANFEF